MLSKLRLRVKLIWLARLGLAGLLAFAWLAPAASARADGQPIDPKAITFDQHMDAQVPAGAVLHDENGQTVHLGDYFGKAPVIVQFGYYDCPMLCDLVFQDLAKKIPQMGLTAGQQFTMVTISIDPREKPDLAALKKRTFLGDSHLQDLSSHWHWLTADNQAVVDQLTQIAGFHYQYDAAQNEFAHPTGVIVLTPQGKISRYIFGIDFKPNDLRLAVIEASNNKIGTPVDALVLMCYHYNPVTGKYNLAVHNLEIIGGTATVLLILGGIGFLIANERRQTPPPASGQV